MCIRDRVPRLTLRELIPQIWRREFNVMCSQDHVMLGRIQKRLKQGWIQTNDPSDDPSWIYVPRPSSDFGAVRLLLDARSDPMGRKLAGHLTSIGRSVVRIFRIETPNLSDMYESHRRQIEQENSGDANEVHAWHGTQNSDEVRDGIASRGFDNRFWFSGAHMFGMGCYFAENIKKADGYASSGQSTGPLLMFYCRVLLGRQEAATVGSHTQAQAPSHGFHSIVGSKQDNLGDEYILFRYGQAVPVYQIEYK
eukprot:TRINITY_DN14226_c0_g1_i1.p1 TRINITY_DN14226_c0_g1~~TRINITY_DN14226_c0_g1_i1.p1  ORF type:complete len:252 (-),score=65.87 TRINITY_DN14226_c0_g1_i1:226-981(-)